MDSVGTRKSGLLKAVYFRYSPKLLEYPFNLVCIYSAGSNGLRGWDWMVFGRVFFARVFGKWGYWKFRLARSAFCSGLKLAVLSLVCNISGLIFCNTLTPDQSVYQGIFAKVHLEVLCEGY